MSLKLIMACDRAGFVATDTLQLPWHLKADLQHFKSKTTAQTVIMGHSTLKTLPNPWNTTGLPHRQNIVVSTQYTGPLKTLRSLEELLGLCQQNPLTPYWLIGGANLATQVLTLSPEILSDIWLTIVQGPTQTAGPQIAMPPYSPGLPQPPVPADDQPFWTVKGYSHNPAAVGGPNDQAFSIVHWARRPNATHF